MSKNILISLNAVVYNRGSEALVRGLSSILKQEDVNITLMSSESEFGEHINLDNIDSYVKKINYKNKSVKRYLIAILRKLKLKSIADNIQYGHLKDILKKQDIIFIIGADNYDITYNMQEQLYGFDSFVRKNTNAKMILYNCSIDERDITEVLKKDLENFECMTIRESISENNVKKINNNIKIYNYSDPAFAMKPQEVKLPQIFQLGKVIGINLSNLITNSQYGGKYELILKSYKNMINEILNNTEYNIVLIPHVMKNADLSTLKELYKEYDRNNRVELIENESLNSKQLKYIISKCDMFIGARTHATIAAYSSCVPTLVLGYSVKSRGIANDLFGTDDNYVLQIANLQEDDYLVKGFRWLNENKNNIRERLNENIPNYINKAKKVIELIG